MTRFPRCVMATAVVPWTDQFTLAESLFREEITSLVEGGFPNLYVFGTAGEGYAVDDTQFEQVARVFVEEMRRAGAEPMVGVINLSMATIVRRIAFAHETLGVNLFQVSLPSWGALEDVEVRNFFDAVLGRFADCQFLHYNLLRTKRLVTGAQYAGIAADHPNLVATKNSTDSMQRIRELAECAPMLRHFLNERGFVYGSLIGEPGLLMSIASLNLELAQRFFRAGCQRDIPTLIQMDGELHRISAEFAATVGEGAARIDGAYDKVLWRMHEGRFPLRLLPPYVGASVASAEHFAQFLRQNYPDWT